MNQELYNKLKDQNSYLRKAYIRMSKGRSMYEAERLRYKTLNAQLNQKLKELEEMEAARSAKPQWLARFVEWEEEEL